MIKTAKQAKAIFEKHGAKFLRLSRFHNGEWLVSTRYSSWEVYGKVQEGVAKDEAFRQAVGTYNYLCRTNGAQHRRRHRSLSKVRSEQIGSLVTRPWHVAC
jgi:hypothetical protein